MQISQVVLALSLTLAAFGQGSAQSRFIVLSTQASVGAALPLNCQEQVAVLRQAWEEHPATGDRTYILACDDQAWQTVLAYGAATRTQVPSLGYTLIRLQLVHGDVSQTSTRHFGRGPVARLVGNLFARGLKPRRL